MIARRALTLALLLVLGAAAAVRAEGPAAAADPPAASAVSAGGAAAPDALAAPVSLRWAALRVVGATVAVGLLLLACVLGYRRLLEGRGSGRTRRPPGAARGWLARWVPEAPAEEDRIHLLSRSYLGARESVGVIRVGQERFLIGIAATGIALLARLEPGEPAEAGVATPDFAAALDEIVGPVGRPAEASIRAALDRSRERLATTSRLAATAGGPHA